MILFVKARVFFGAILESHKLSNFAPANSVLNRVWLSLYAKLLLGASMESQKLSIFNMVILFFISYDTVPLCEGIFWRQPRKSKAGHPSSNDLCGGSQVSQT